MEFPFHVQDQLRVLPLWTRPLLAGRPFFLETTGRNRAGLGCGTGNLLATAGRDFVPSDLTTPNSKHCLARHMVARADDLISSCRPQL